MFSYAGVITEEVVNRDSCYVYTMERDQIRRTVRSYHGPELFLDALKVGNIARFVRLLPRTLSRCSTGRGKQLLSVHASLLLTGPSCFDFVCSPSLICR